MTLMRLILALCTGLLACAKSPRFKLSDSNPSLFIGGLFHTFALQVNAETNEYYLLRDELGIQQLAAFLMAVDSINDHTDGVLDNIFLGLTLGFSIDINGHTIATGIGENGYFDGSQAAYNMMLNAYSSDNPVFGVVSGLNNDPAIVATEILNGWYTPVIGTYADAAELSSSQASAYTLRLNPSEYLGVLPILRLLKKNSWNRVAVLYSTDSQGFNAYTAFQALSWEGLVLLNTESINVLYVNFDSLIKSIKKSGATIVVVLAPSNTLAKFLVEAYTRGLLVDGSQIIGLVPVMYSDLISAGASAKIVPDIMKGFLTVRSAEYLHFQTPLGQKFLSQYRRLTPTMTIESDGSVVCSNRTDDTGYDVSLFKYTISSQDVCLGMQSFSSIAMDGSNLDPSVLYTYVAVHAYAVALNYLVFSNESFVGLVEVYDALLTPLALRSYSTALGQIQFSRGLVGSSIATGDRITGQIFEILNYKSVDASGEIEYATVGLVDDALGVVGCESSTYSFSCSAARYRTSDGKLASDMKPDTYTYTSPATKTVLFFFGSVVVVLSLAFLVLFIHYRDTKTIRNAQFKVLSIIKVACVLSGIRVILGGIDVSKSVCAARFWIGHFAFRLIFSAMVLKLWRIDKLINTSGIRRITLTEEDLLKRIAAHLLLLLIPLCVLQGIGGLSTRYLTSTSANQKDLQLVCTNSGYLANVLVGVIYVSEMLYLIMALVYLYKTRAVPPQVNEVKILAPTLMLTTAIIVVVAITIFILKLNSAQAELAVCAAYIASTILGSTTYSVNKYLQIRLEAAPAKTVAVTVSRRPTSNKVSSVSTARTDIESLAEQAVAYITSHEERMKFIQKNLDVWNTLLVKAAEAEGDPSMSAKAEALP